MLKKIVFLLFFSIALIGTVNSPFLLKNVFLTTEATTTGWVQSNGNWYYYDSNGQMVTGWLDDNGTWYYMNSSGVMQTGWLYYNATWYYLNSSGAMVTGWLQSNNQWYYLQINGAMLTGWLQYYGHYYYLDRTGAEVVSNWVQDNNHEYYLDSNGYMVTGWLSWGGNSYYLDASGAMVTGWLQLGSYYYYFNSSGAMVTNQWLNVTGNTYYFNSNGTMASNTTVDGYPIGPSGALAITSNPYEVPSNVASGWNSKYGDKNYSTTSGADLVYDVYKDKFNANGYSIIYQDYGKGVQPYINFKGWSVLRGYAQHTVTNQDTYIVAKKIGGTSGIGTTKIYSTLNINLSATNDLQYNYQGNGTVWNECPAGTTNVEPTTCNLRYDYVGFNAYLPINDLFPNETENATWQLYIVKRVDSQLVYSRLVLPFSFTNKPYKTGTFSLTSGINANQLQMVSSDVLRRLYAREDAPTVTNELGADRFFTQGSIYTSTNYDESETAIWYGVYSPKDGNTRWADTAYWIFTGYQAQLAYQAPPKPADPPVAAFTYSPTPTYNNTTVTFTNQSYDVDGDSLTYNWEYQQPYSTTWTSFSTAKNPTKVLNIKGNWNIRLTVSDGTYTDSVTKVVTVSNRPPVANFTYSPSTNVHTSTTVQLTDKSTDPDGDSLMYTWEYQQPGSSTWTSFSQVKNPTHVFNIQGTWYVRLTVNDGTASSSITKAVAVDVPNSPPTAAFIYSPSTVYNDTNITFTNQSSDSDGDPLSYTWQYQKPGSSTWTIFSTATNPTQVLNVKGNWNVKLTVTDGIYTVSVTKTITVNNRPPVPNFSYSPSTIFINTPVSFTNSSTDPDKDSLTYTWEYQQPNSTTWTSFSTAQNPTQVLNQKGNWNIRLTASDGTASASVTKVVTVGNRPPVAAFSYSPGTIFNDTTVSFTNGSTDPDNDSLTYLWEYQQPGTNTWTGFSNAKDTSKVLNIKGNWNILLTVSDGTASASTTQMVTVGNRPPVPNFSYSPSMVYDDTALTFTNTSTDPDHDSMTYNWEYQQPGSTVWTSFSTAQNPTTVLNIKGNWNIRLTVSDGTVSASTTQTVTVGNRPPVPNFSFSPSTIYNNTVISFTNTSNDPDNDPMTYTWEYQQPNSTTWISFSTAQNPTSVFTIKGNWNVRLTVSDGTTSASITKVVTVSNRPPVANFTFNPTTNIYNDTVVSFTNASTDPDNDPLTYQWAYQQPGSTTWTNFSTAQNPTQVLNIKGTWGIRLIVTDSSGTTATSIQNPTVLNRPPSVTVTYSPSQPYEGDPVNVCATPTDPDKDLTTVKIFLTKDGGTEQMVLNQSNVSSGFQQCYSFVAGTGRYDVRATVNDGVVEVGGATWFYPTPLTIQGFVQHTPIWLAKHVELNQPLDQFYSGEQFNLEAQTSPYPVVYVKSTFTGTQSNDNAYTGVTGLAKSTDTLYTGNLYDPSFLVYPTSLKPGPAACFVFEVKYTNGVVKTAVVPITIISDVYQAYRLHESF